MLVKSSDTFVHTKKNCRQARSWWSPSQAAFDVFFLLIFISPANFKIITWYTLVLPQPLNLRVCKCLCRIHIRRKKIINFHVLNLYTLAVYFFAPSDALSKQCKAFKRIATKLQSVWAKVNEMDTMRTYVRCSFGSWFWFGYDTVRLKKNIHIHILCMLYYSGFSALSFKTNWNFTIPRLPSICIRNHPKPSETV